MSSGPPRQFDAADRERHWNNVYQSKAPSEVSWYQSSPDVSLTLIRNSGVALSNRILDVGGGASLLAEALLRRGHMAITVVDIAMPALDAAKRRLGSDAARIDWVVADVTGWHPEDGCDVWHDRAVFHFLVEPEDRRGYMAALRTALSLGGTVILATFALDGPERCSGLPVRRYSPEMLAAELGDGFALVETIREDHLTPTGAMQRFVYCRFRREAAGTSGGISA